MHPRVLPRLLEIVPTASVWLIITAPVWAAIVAPAALGFFLVLFSIYWLWKSANFAAGVAIGYWRLQHAQKRDWAAAAATQPGFENVHHLVLFPTYGESDEILADTLHCVSRQDFPLDRVSVVLAFEERDAQAPARAERLVARFGSLFEHLLVTFHPELPGEVKGKSSNLTWAARRVQEELIDSGKVDPEHLIVTVCDADSRLHRGYLSALSHDVLTHPNGRLHIFQPAILFYANHWRLIAPLRAMNSIYSLWELARMVPSHRLVTQSTYSLSWSAVHEVGYWDVDVIPEDSHMCFKVLFHFGQRVKVRPIFLPVYADAAEGPTLRRTFVNQYQQILRWAWGVSEIPYVTMGAARANDLPWHLRVRRVAWYVEEHLMWPSHWFLLTLGGLVPAHDQSGVRAQPAWHLAGGPDLDHHGGRRPVFAAGHRRRLAAATGAPRGRRHRRRADRLGVVRAAADLWAAAVRAPSAGCAHAIAVRAAARVPRDREGAGASPLPGPAGARRATCGSRCANAAPATRRRPRPGRAVRLVLARQHDRGD